MSEFVTKDSGQRQEFETGSKRDSRAGKGRFDLIAPEPLKRLAQLYERGAQKYGDRNWEKGQPLSRYLDSASRHINDYMCGDRSEDHLISAVWNLFGFVATEFRIKQGKLPAELDDVNGPVANLVHTGPAKWAQSYMNCRAAGAEPITPREEDCND